MKYKFYGCEDEFARNYFASYTYFIYQKPVPFSQKFCEFFSENFEQIFIRETSIKPSIKVGLTKPNRDDSPQLYEPGLISKLNPVLWIMPDYYDDISFCWKSKTGIIVKPTDEDFDTEDLECWIEGLKPAEYWKQVATEKKAHPFIIPDLPYALKVFAFGIDMELRLHLDTMSASAGIQKIISETIGGFNEKSGKANRQYGVVHNYRFWEEGNMLTVRIDTGSAGIEIIKLILKALKKATAIRLVEIDI